MVVVVVGGAAAGAAAVVAVVVSRKDSEHPKPHRNGKAVTIARALASHAAEARRRGG